jgi:hypothetical protein
MCDSALAHTGLSRTNLQVTTAEDGTTGIIRVAMDTEAKSGNFYGPAAGWTGYPDLLPPEALLTDESNSKVFWNGCEKAVGKFEC